MPTLTERASEWYELFNRYAGDLYPGRYTLERCRELAEMSDRISELAARKQSTIIAHNYLYPEFHEIAAQVGDSLGLSLWARDAGAVRVDFESVYFMGATAKLITGDDTRVFVCDAPRVLGCSLVFGTDHRWVEKWRERNPGGIVVTYINSDVAMKAISDYICTSRNAAAVLKAAVEANPGKRVLMCPDKYLGWVTRAMAGLSEEVVEIYEHHFSGFHACCYVHEKVNPASLDRMLDEHPEAELLIHPECGCASTCLFRVQNGEIPHQKAYFLSTEQMLWHARKSPAKEFVVATEKGMIYRLRKEVPEKVFYPVADEVVCDFMKQNTFEKLLRSLEEDRIEIIFCDDCCDPREPYTDDRVTHIPRSAGRLAMAAIDRMLAI
ncbi:MAG: quinolinate synthase NadA [Armatimonadetes bacterium]|nr:quinolinate synthase NadA [Armatimonadota bacterium]